MSQNTETTFVSDLTRFSVYKRNQGRLARRLTAGAIVLIFALGARSFESSFMLESAPAVRWSLLGIVTLLGVWVAFRVVHHAQFAEFLISTESEVEKVHWPDREHVRRATVVVIVTMLLMGALLFVFDLVWQWLFTLIGFLIINQ